MENIKERNLRKLENRHKRFAERLGLSMLDERIGISRSALEKVSSRLTKYEKYMIDAIRLAN